MRTVMDSMHKITSLNGLRASISYFGQLLTLQRVATFLGLASDFQHNFFLIFQSDPTIT